MLAKIFKEMARARTVYKSCARDCCSKRKREKEREREREREKREKAQIT